MPIIKATAVTPENYAPYGQVLRAEALGPQVSANMGTAVRFTELADLKNLRPKAKPHLSIYRCQPYLEGIDINLLERHEHSTQIFWALNPSAKYLGIVSLGKKEPDLSTLQAFVFEGAVGLSYRPGIWHHPMVALGQATDFACLVYEDSSASDCEVLDLAETISIEPPA